ncbi:MULTISPECIES: CHAT domain-containing protein [Cyanophyceae]|uniref:CHAT domain-containing protein n=1 Tax=Cyanophyceae TaxID=3028117 RepID=UPI0018F04EE2
MKLGFRRTSQILSIFLVAAATGGKYVLAQTIVPASDGTGTIVSPSGTSIYNITGGQLSGDKANLFHSFTKFGIDQNQIVNFLSNPSIQNIFGRVGGGEASVINGIIQVTGGNSNLFLLNPAGIVFGANAILNVPASFTATTATGIGFNSGWFNTMGGNDYAALVGNPNAFVFNTSQPGTIINEGQLSVGTNQNLTLLGGTVVSTGELQAPGGKIVVAAVPGESLVRISLAGNLLNLEVGTGDLGLEIGNPNALSLPQLLTGSGVGNATGLTLDNNGQVRLTGSGLLVENGDVAIKGAIATQTATLSAANNLTLVESQLLTTGNLQLLAQNTVRVRDSVANPFIAHAGGNLFIQGNQNIDILALNHLSQTPFVSGGDLNLVSDGNISGDTHFASGGSLSMLKLSGQPGDFVSLYDPIISSNGNVSFGNYSGVALKIEAKGSIQGGNITITGPDINILPGSDPDIALLTDPTTNGALILRAGVDELANPVNISAPFSSPATGLLPAGSIQVGRINTGTNINGVNAGPVIVQAKGNINIFRISASWNGLTGSGNGGNINLDAEGDITINDSNVSVSSNGNGGDITFNAAGSISFLDVLSRGENGIGGNITITAGSNIESDDIQTRGGLNGGNITIISTGGTINTAARNAEGSVASCISSSGVFCAAGSTGDISLTAANGIILGGSNVTGSDQTGTLKGRNITLISNEIDFTRDRPISGTGDITIQPFTPDGAIAIGGIDNTTTALDLTATELGLLQDGFASLTIGRIDGSGTITIPSNIIFSDPVKIQSPNGAIAVNGIITGTGNASITLNSATTTLNAAIATSGTDITLGNNIQLGTDITLDSGGGNITFNGSVDGNQRLTLNSTGTTTFLGAVGSNNPLNILTTDALGNTRINGNVNASQINFQDTLELLSDATLTAAEINLGNAVSGSGRNLGLQPLTPSQNLTIAATGTSFADGFNSINIGQADGSGAIALSGDITFNDPVIMRSPLLSGSITATGTITGLGDASITLLANQNITTNNITANGGINLTSLQGSVSTRNLNSSGVTQGGDINIIASNTITTGAIDSSSLGDGGNVTLDPSGNIQVVSINAQGGTNGTGGNVDISTERFFLATGTFTDQNQEIASISTAGGVWGGDITIRHGGGLRNTPFNVGDATNNGTSGSLTSGNYAIAPNQSFPGSYTLGNIKIITDFRPPVSRPPMMPPELPPPPVVMPPVVLPPPVVMPPLVLPPPVVMPPVVAPPDVVMPPVVAPPDVSFPSQTALIDSQLESLQISPSNDLDSDSIDFQIGELEQNFTQQFEQHLKQPAITRGPSSLPDIRNQLRKIHSATGIKPAIIYVFFVPAVKVSVDSELIKNPNSELQSPEDELELVLVTSKGKTIRKVTGVKRSQALKVAQQFSNKIKNVASQQGYLTSSQQLYQWLIAPLEADLQAEDIQNLVFILDSGLRSMPLAALHDGKQFLVEKYSLSLMPSLTLTDTRYTNIKNSKLLAMGSSEFSNQKPLPAVPVELATITQLWQGKSFLNDGFTLENLKSQRSKQPFGIVHLATHAEFQPGDISNSYIQLWNQQLRLDQLRTLGWNNPPVELLVLSACRTALGDEEAELGFAGLAVQAGVKSALASLWYISDEGTLGVMTEFYQQLKKAPIKAEALRRAQIAMLKGQIRLQSGYLYNSKQRVDLPSELSNLRNTTFTHPYYWAAFTMIGNPW